ncbi:hypothetical protein BCV69DRAFT_311410 [Microstroma glucosiphilum]|uniref:Uncharacterized protein n=1 Tax=Pseudomicrostroma glucosiphilum TaxID=1684307 RepID=A0A316U8Y7_9BASI|nr:hypothetical protein BCV69DRAFT_311410 [Pseudomicrostroma glucosiphilum]PWN21676.1 hypothetical protein BCV69DRAFT_311410 [Pseudomicrostroma glucosiphilum]
MMLSRSIWRSQLPSAGGHKEAEMQEAQSSKVRVEDIDIAQSDLSWADESFTQRSNQRKSPSLAAEPTVDFPQSPYIAEFFAPSTASTSKPMSRSSRNSSSASRSDDSSLAEAAKTSLTLPSSASSAASQGGSATPSGIDPADVMNSRRDRSAAAKKSRRAQFQTKSAPSTPRGNRRALAGSADAPPPVPDLPSLASPMQERVEEAPSLRQSFSSRNLASLRNLAAAWVPGKGRSTNDSHSPAGGRSPELQTVGQQQLVPLPKDGDKQLAALPSARRGSVRLDRRRIDKAASLAMEAAEAAEEDERIRREKERRRKARAAERIRRASIAEKERRQRSTLLGRIKTLSEYGALSDGEGGSNFGSLYWRKQGSAKVSSSPPKSIPLRPRTTPNSPHSSDEDFLYQDDDDYDDLSETDDDDEEDDEEDNFSLSLYLSSLSYLLSALPSRDAAQLPEKERDALRAKLQEVLRDIGGDEQNSLLDGGSSAGPATEAAREERLRELLETELRRAEARMTGGSQSGRSAKTNSGPRIPTNGDASSQSGNMLASTVAYSALELTFTVAAAGLGLVGSGLSRFVPPVPADKAQAPLESSTVPGAKIIGEVAEDNLALSKQDRPLLTMDQTAVAVAPAAPAKRTNRSGGAGNGLQWDLAMALASSTASTLYGCLSSAADEAARQDAALTKARQQERKGQSDEAILADHAALAAVTEEDMRNMPEDQLILLSASFARALKHSPLPSQLASLSSQLLALLHSVDERYSLTKRATDEALKRTRQGLGYARRRGWHVKVVRAAWAVVEMSVAGVEAWREEETPNANGGGASQLPNGAAAQGQGKR